MKNRRVQYFLLVIGLMAAGAVLGRFASTALSQGHYVVQVAERVKKEETENLSEQTLQSKALRETGVPRDQLLRDARDIRRQFRFGSTLFGLWAGLVISLKLIGIGNRQPSVDYHPEPDKCLACTRCFRSCPVEHERLKETGKV